MYYTSRQTSVRTHMLISLRQRTVVPTSKWQYHGNQFFQRQTTMMKDTCPSIDEDYTGTDSSRSKQQWRDPLVILLMVTKMQTSLTVNTRTTYQWKQVDSVCMHTLSRFEATDSSNKQMTIQISNFPTANHNDNDEGHSSLYCWWYRYRAGFPWANNNEESHLLSLYWWYQRCGQIQ